jgi:hypothetical protein
MMIIKTSPLGDIFFGAQLNSIGVRKAKRNIRTLNFFIGHLQIRVSNINFLKSSVELNITSLNSHCPLRELSTEFGRLVARGKVWIKVETVEKVLTTHFGYFGI